MNFDNKLELTLMPFEKKMIFTASQELASRRSKEFALPVEAVYDAAQWDKKAPDFSPKLYKSLNLPRNRIDRKFPRLLPHVASETSQNYNRVPSYNLPEIRQKRTSPPFIVRCRPPDSLESKVIFVKYGKYPSMDYSNPKPHDFRQYNDDVPDIVTTFPRDPGNLIFKSQHLSAIGGTQTPEDFHQRERPRRLDTFKPVEPKWDSQLILVRGPWPPRSASYMRHRRRRGADSSFMDRVEEKLCSGWTKR